MEKYLFGYKNDYGEPNLTIQFETEAPHISEFHRMCKAFAAAVGYADKSIEEYFGPSYWEDD